MPMARLPALFRVALLAMAIVGGHAAQARDLDLNVPLVVAQLADDYVASLLQPVQAADLRAQYARGFFLGFVNPDGNMNSAHDTDVMQRANQAGQAYWHAHPRERDRIFQGYGYLRVTVQGTWSTGWERNDFVPDGASDENWNLDALGNRTLADGGLMHRRPPSSRVGITGYVNARSAASRYLGQYRRFALVTAMWPADVLMLPDTTTLRPLP